MIRGKAENGRLSDPYLPEREALIIAVTETAGSLPSETRKAIVDRTRDRDRDFPIADSLASFADKVARDATLVTDADIESLIGAGFSEESVFETLAAAALGASLARLERVDQLLDGES